MRKQSDKTKRILAYMEKRPAVTAKEVAARFEVHVSRVYQLKKQLQDKEDAKMQAEAADAAYAAFDQSGDPGPTPEHEAALQAQAALKEAMMSPRQRAAEKRHRMEKFRLTKEQLDQWNKKHGSPSVDKVLDARAVDYGKFKDGARLMQSMKRLMSDHANAQGKTFADDQWEALEMIVHKIGRIINGNPDKVDHWTDIAGYAKLVADRLEGNVR